MRHDFDLCITANNEGEFGCRGIQYVHFPWNYQPPAADELRWYHGSLVLQAYYRLCFRIAEFSCERMKQNLTLVNSDWIGDKVREWYGIDSTTVYPPVAGSFSEVPWNDRADGFVCIGRIQPYKEVDTMIDIVASLKERGASTHLHIIGSADDVGYFRHILERVQANPSWLFLHENPDRKELVDLICRHRFGIHGMREEHFGMAPAEMTLGGCIVFVPRSGGQVEIVANDDRLTYQSVEDAVDKILRVMGDVALQAELRAHLDSRKELFSAKRFARRIQEIVDHFET